MLLTERSSVIVVCLVQILKKQIGSYLGIVLVELHSRDGVDWLRPI